MIKYFKDKVRLQKKILNQLIERRVVSAIDVWLGKSKGGYDFNKISKIMAAVETARFFQDVMPTTMIYESRVKLHHAAFGLKNIEGLILEFGVAGGFSINRIAKAFPLEKVYGFDSFEGLPEAWTSKYQEGHFAQVMPEVESNVTLVKGWFNETLPEFLKLHKEHVALIHIDCDLYSSTKTIFDSLANRIKPGTVIIFDEYFNYPGWEQHEYKAFIEFAKDNNVEYHYAGAVGNNKQVIVVIDAIESKDLF